MERASEWVSEWVNLPSSPITRSLRFAYSRVNRIFKLAFLFTYYRFNFVLQDLKLKMTKVLSKHVFKNLNRCRFSWTCILPSNPDKSKNYQDSQFETKEKSTWSHNLLTVQVNISTPAYRIYAQVLLLNLLPWLSEQKEAYCWSIKKVIKFLYHD